MFLKNILTRFEHGHYLISTSLSFEHFLVYDIVQYIVQGMKEKALIQGSSNKLIA